MSKTKWYQKPIYLLVALALVLSLGIVALPMVPQAAASPDQATFYSTIDDGYILQSSSNYSVVHGASSGVVTSSSILLGVGQFSNPGTGEFVISRGALFFDTSSLPNDACITSATLSLYGRSYDTLVDFELTVVDGSVLNKPLQDADYGNLRSQNVSGGSFNTSGFSISGYNDIPLNETGMGWISKTGITKFGLRSSREIAATEPTQKQGVSVCASEQGEGYQPRLVVTYTTPPVAAFNASPTSGCAPLTVNFTDLSTGNATTWNWTFGDGGTSTDQNPSHTYNNTGTYTVTLTVTNDCGSNSTTKANFITVSVAPPPVGGEAYPVRKVSILAPWIAMAVLLAGGTGWYVLRRRRAEN